MRCSAFLSGKPIFEVLTEKSCCAVHRARVPYLDIIQIFIVKLQSRHVTLINQIFFVFDIVIQASFG